VRSKGGRVRRNHHGQAGLTLIEVIVALVLLGVGVVAMLGGLATVQRSAGTATDQTQLEAAVRQVGDFLRESASSVPGYSSPTCPSGATCLPYLKCGQASAYQSRSEFTTGLGSTFISKWGVKIIEVDQETSASLNGSPQTAEQPGCTSSTSDYGVQRITFSVTDQSTSRSLVRAVFKWDPNAS
jgi:prepilin-type N-terminal cleavage/methylation domain-containing protein